STRELLRHKYGLSDEQADAATSNVQDIARGDGLQPYVVSDNVVGSTQLAHEFLAWATTKGKHADAWHRISRRYFGEAKSIFDIGSLADLATDLGLDAGEAREALESGEYRSAVEADVRLGHERGVAGVPFFVIDERYAVSGAHPTETLLEVIRGAWDETPRAVASSA
ncbi:MAG TPA: DsbA family protein, partial [Baekduia sp.]|nr:DsbA family protein [Baekduia sp.]